MAIYAKINQNMLVGGERLHSSGTEMAPQTRLSGTDPNTIIQAMATAPFRLIVWARRADPTGMGELLVEIDESAADSFTAWYNEQTAAVELLGGDVTTIDGYLAGPDGWKATPALFQRMARTQTAPAAKDDPIVFSTVIADNPAPLRAEKYENIDKKTQEIIAQGFTYNSKTFSLSANAQTTYLGMYNARSVLTYPITVNTIDDTDTQDLADETEVTDFYNAGVAAVRAALDGGTALKAQVTNATTEALVEAVVDNR